MKPADMKLIGKIDGEPVYEVSTIPSPASQSRQVPIRQRSGDSDAEHRIHCLPCLFGSLLGPLEEFESFVAGCKAGIHSIDCEDTGDCAEEALLLQEERADLVEEMELASTGVAAITALIQTGAKFLP